MASLNLTLLPLFLLHLFYQFSEAEFSPSTANLSDLIIEDPCKNALCGEGKCRPDSLNLLFGYDCDCYKGWAKPNVFNFTERIHPHLQPHQHQHLGLPELITKVRIAVGADSTTDRRSRVHRIRRSK
ncbi:hypothetical protein QJS10_CPA07g00542 [Acorus calamus]|uniref:EGF-like domain-containing protein n=1 Tax=Acorus calamus TaxID=4465 RepID=A0AAV9EH58_ACOCL|nr:hypothetical protein QJS10_CPA07g00542 [Acorus calamus]